MNSRVLISKGVVKLTVLALNREERATSESISPVPTMKSNTTSSARRTLEEIRQKRAAEKMNTVSSGSDLGSSNYRPDSRYQTSERDMYELQNRLKELESRNTDLERENQNLLSKIEEKDIEKDSLTKRLNDTLIEKDATMVTKEDALSQLRTLKRRLKEAEEEQYRAEEDAAALRAELNVVQQQVLSNNNNNNNNNNANYIAIEGELQALQNQLKEESVLRQEAQQNLSAERVRVSNLMNEKHDLEEKLTALNQKISEESSQLAAHRAFSLEDKERLENKLHRFAVTVEKLENSRQTLLAEIDSQSSEIERLFEENSSLSQSHQEAMLVSTQWENQVRECFTQNEELRAMLDELRSQQVENTNMQGLNDENLSNNSTQGSEIAPIKEQLAKEQSKSESLAAQVSRLSADLRRAVQSYNNLTRMYRPVLKEIETNLVKMKQETYSTI